MRFYRYETYSFSTFGENKLLEIHSAKLKLIEFSLVKQTPKGYWIGEYYNSTIPYYATKWISKTSKKRYAYPTKEEALNNYIKRTEIRIEILSGQLSSSKVGLNLAKLEEKLVINEN